MAKAEGIPKIKEAEHERLLSQTASLKEECLRLEANYSTVNSNGYKKSKNIREERDLLDPKEKEKQNSVYKKQNKVSFKNKFCAIFCFLIFLLYKFCFYNLNL